MSRLQLLVEVLQRVQRMLSQEDQANYAGEFAPYLKGTSGQYVYRIKGEEIEDHLRPIGELMHRLVEELRPVYSEEPAYQMLVRVFYEQQGPGTREAPSKYGYDCLCCDDQHQAHSQASSEA